MLLRAAARAERTTLADSSCSFLPGSVAVPREMTYRRLVSSCSYIVTLVVLMAVGRAGGLGWSTVRLLDNVEVIYLKHLFRQEEESAAVNPLNATRGLWLDKFFLVLASHPPEARPGDLKNQSPLHVKHPLRHSSDKLLAKYGQATRAQGEAGIMEPPTQALSNVAPQNIAHVLHNPQSLQIELARSAASKTN